MNTEPRTLRIELPLPPAGLSPNARGAWQKKARLTKRYRELACWLTRDARRKAGLPRRAWPRAVATAHFFWPVLRARDVDNAQASLKAAFDGMVDAGLIAGDRADVLTHRPPVFAIDKKRPRVMIEVAEATT